MTSEEIASEITKMNRSVLNAWDDQEYLTQEELLKLLDSAAINGFQFGSKVALSMVQASLLIQLARLEEKKAVKKNRPGSMHGE
jgi:hypothetical protein